MKRVTVLMSAGLAAAACDGGAMQPRALANAEPARGRATIERVGCAACHQIPGVRGPKGRVGPSLDGFAERALIGGRVPNRPDLLVLWVRDAPALIPGTGMPPMPLTESESRDVAAYLYTLDAR